MISYTLNPAETVSRPSSGLPAFPQGDPEKARTAAETFVKRLLGAGESLALEEPRRLDSLDSTTYRFLRHDLAERSALAPDLLRHWIRAEDTW